DQARSAATLTLMIAGLWVLNLFARPITPPRAALVGAMTAIFLVIVRVPGFFDWFDLGVPRTLVIASAIGCGLAAGAMLELGCQIMQWRCPAEQRRTR